MYKHDLAHNDNKAANVVIRMGAERPLENDFYLTLVAGSPQAAD